VSLEVCALGVAQLCVLTAAAQVTHTPADFTPPQYISLLFTDQGVLTPSAVSDQLIVLYT
jgi:translation initiation factor eIF-2B subunit alpha